MPDDDLRFGDVSGGSGGGGGDLVDRLEFLIEAGISLIVLAVVAYAGFEIITTLLGSM